MHEEIMERVNKTNNFFKKYAPDLTPRERDIFRLRYGFDDGRYRTIEEISELFGITKEEVKKYIKQIEFPMLGYYHFVFCIFGGNDVPPFRSFDFDKLKELSDKTLEFLNEQESMLLKLRFGLTVPKSYTLKQCGEELGVCGERARQIEKKALRKLHHPDRCRALREYIKTFDMNNKE